MTLDQLAQTGYEANRAYSASLGEFNPPWVEADEDDRQAWRIATRHLVDWPTCTDVELHWVWLALERKLGWSYGPILDNESKRHPHHVAWDELPVAQRRKVSMFRAIVEQLVR